MGVSTSVGANLGSAFLLRTPELIEDGLRAVVGEAVPGLEVTKRRLLLGESGLSMNPDLVFGRDLAVGDVKYRFLQADWHRPDLNQAVAFATALRCSLCVVLGFVRDKEAPRPRPVPVGPVFAHTLAWVVSPMEPHESAARLKAEVAKLLGRAVTQS